MSQTSSITVSRSVSPTSTPYAHPTTFPAGSNCQNDIGWYTATASDGYSGAPWGAYPSLVVGNGGRTAAACAAICKAYRPTNVPSGLNGDICGVAMFMSNLGCPGGGVQPAVDRREVIRVLVDQHALGEH